ncbi:hypothetical protein [Aliiroseovarius crassostreae]|uniref:hypothetical protein n=1 Tax=Aliiroseovarius crassostreae TaxID=154981 RepID=UPI003C7CA925
MTDLIYGEGFSGHDAERDALHIGNLAKAGVAACDSATNIRNLEVVLEALFEEIAIKAFDLAVRIDTETRPVEKIKQDAA